MLKDAIDVRAVRRALVIKLRHHGDVLLTSPVFTVLKNHAPHIEIDALVYADTMEMLSLHPAISELHSIDRGWKKQGVLNQFRHEFALMRRLQARHYDLVIHLTESNRGAWLAHRLGARWAVARRYPEKRGRFWRSSFTHLYDVPAKPRHTVETHLDALRRLGVYPGQDERKLMLVPGDTADQSITALLQREGLSRHGFVHVHPTSRWMFKCWEADKFAALINTLLDAGEQIVLTAAPSEEERRYVARIVTQLRKSVTDLSGQLNLKQLAALTANAKCLIGVDSVPMHIAAAMGTPVVALFGPSGDLEWGPWQVPCRVITSTHSCRPCGMDGCAGSKISECLTSIPVDAVRMAFQELVG